MANYISITNNVSGSGFSIDSRKLKKIVELILRLFSFENVELSISFVDRKTIKNLNSTYRKVNKPTDVLSFPQIEFKPPLSIMKSSTKAEYPSNIFNPNDEGQNHLLLGDIIICPTEVIKNLKKIQDLSCEIALLVVHSFLHLCGQDHAKKKDTKLMFSEQLLIVRLISSINTTPLWKDMVKIDKYRKT